MGHRCIYKTKTTLWNICWNFITFFFFPQPRISYIAFTSRFTIYMRHLLCPVSHPLDPLFLQTLLWKPAANRCLTGVSGPIAPQIFHFLPWDIFFFFNHSTGIMETYLKYGNHTSAACVHERVNTLDQWVTSMNKCCSLLLFRWAVLKQILQSFPKGLEEGSPSRPQEDQ